MAKFLIVSPGYPSRDDKYNNGFVHSRVKNYQEKGLEFDVFSYDKGTPSNYEYEGIKVIKGGKKEYIELLKQNKYEKILVHFGFAKIIKPLIKYTSDTPLIIWVHGTEALGWYRRLFAFNIKKAYRFLGYIILNTRQMLFLHTFINNNRIDKTFVFVSEWMKNIMETDTFSKGKISKYTIIPNVVDDKIFTYKEKSADDRLNILSIRSYQSKKYANDISVKTVQLLSKEPFFNKLTFSFYGDGRLFEKTIKPLREFKNVVIYQKFLNHKEIHQVHLKNGIMLIPTRQDAQGVSMCEAMSSGLVPVTSNNTAIPEYVNESCGYLGNNVDDLKDAIKEMYYNPDIFLKKSKKASQHINKICSPQIVINKELNLIKRK